MCFILIIWYWTEISKFTHRVFLSHRPIIRPSAFLAQNFYVSKILSFSKTNYENVTFGFVAFCKGRYKVRPKQWNGILDLTHLSRLFRQAQYIYTRKGNILRKLIGVCVKVKVSGPLHCTLQHLLADIPETQRKLKFVQPIWGANKKSP
jgi:hypothetical protein